MDEKKLTPSDEEPRDRFRRLLDESKESGEKSTSEKNDIRNISENRDGRVGQPERHSSDGTHTPRAHNSLSRDENHVSKRDNLGSSEKNKDRRTDDTSGATNREVSQESETEKESSLLQENLTTFNHGEDTPPPELGTTPFKSPPAIDSRGMPLPKRVDRIDMSASRATPIAYEKRITKSNYENEILPKEKDPLSKKKKKKLDISKNFGCLIRMLIIGAFVLIISGICLGSIVIYEYFDIAKDLPDVARLRESSSQFETTRILDRNGNVLYEILDPHEGRRTYVTLSDISPYLIAATIATEDKDFYINPGFDPLGIIRAFWQNLSSRETVSGASTITQQLTRLLLFSPEERSQRTYLRKVREAILASEVTRRYTKDEILELYLNEIYYGNLAYGIEAASQTYFGIPAKNLDLGQAAFLAGLPQLPSFYDVYSNRDVTLTRQHSVLLLMFQVSQEKGCIYVSNNLKPICIGAGEAALAAKAIEQYQFVKPEIMMEYPHWVTFIRYQLEEMYDPQTIYRSGFDVYTTIDPVLQNEAQKIVKQQVDNLEDRHVTNGALVAIQPHTGEILAMVGSADFNDDAIDGQVNMSIVPRQPGSSIKPITYIGAFEKGWTPATLIWDVPSEFPPSGDPNDPRPPYIPVNYDKRFHGPVTVRSALANSYNIPAVKTLSYLGIYDNPMTTDNDGFLSLASRLGITTLTRNDYGLSLTLGGGEVSLYEMTKVYAIFANGGRSVPAHGITKIVDYTGNIIFESELESREQLIRPEHAYLITSILADNEARTPAFGSNSILNLPFVAAVKTGTTNDFRDNWTIGYTSDIAVGVWVGNADYTPMINTSGLTGAAPIWAEFMQLAIRDLTGGNPSPFIKPSGVVDRIICEVSGTEPSRWCPSQRREYFAADQLPLPNDNDLWKKVLINTWTGLLVSPKCDLFTDEKLALNVSDPWAIKWVKNDPQGQKWAKEMGFEEPFFVVPNRECNENDVQPILEIFSPQDGAVITEGLSTIVARIEPLSEFKKYRLEYGLGADPVHWEKLMASKNAVVEPTEIYEWDLNELDSGEVTLRLYLEGPENTYAETRVRLTLQVPTPTPTPTPTSTPTPTQTLTPTATSTPLPTNTPTPYYSPTWTSIPIFTIAPSPTP